MLVDFLQGPSALKLEVIFWSLSLALAFASLCPGKFTFPCMANGAKMIPLQLFCCVLRFVPPQASATFCTLSVLISRISSHPTSGSYLISSTVSFPICTMDIISSSCLVER